MGSPIGALLGTLSIFAFNLLLAAACAGLGLGLRRAFGLTRARLEDCLLAFWMGFGLVILFLLLWNFVLPAGPAALGIVLVTGLASAGRSGRAIRSGLAQGRPPRWSMLVALVFALWVANLSTGRLTSWDSSLYHMQGVQWARRYAVVPGLANLFGPLGFNNASFVYNAMLDAGPWSGRAWHVSNGVLVSMFGAQAIFSAGYVTSRRTADAQVHVFPMLMLPIAVNLALGGVVSSFGTAAPQSLLLMVVAIQAYRASTDRSRPAGERAYDFFCVAVLAAVAVSIKVSAAVFAAGLLILACHGALSLDRAIGRLRLRPVIWSLAGVALIGLTWAGRGVVLSGYALFPNRALSLPVEWRVPAEHARAEFDFVVHSAHGTSGNLAYVSGQVEGLGLWLRPWFKSVLDRPFEVFVPSVIAGLAACMLLLSVRRSTRTQRDELRPGWSLLLPLALAIGAWFALAPMPHYGVPLFWSTAAVLGSQAYRLRPRSIAFARRSAAAIGLLAVGPCLVGPLWSKPRSQPINMRARTVRQAAEGILDYNLRLPEPGHWFQTGEPEPQLEVFETSSGLSLNVPRGRFARCWDAPLPCTPNPAPNLRLRVPGTHREWLRGRRRLADAGLAGALAGGTPGSPAQRLAPT